MATETVVFFYTREKTAARKYPWQKVQFALAEEMWYDRVLVAAGIPEYDYGTKHWEKEKLCQKIHTVLAPALKGSLESAFFLCHRSLEKQKEILYALEQSFPLELREDREQWGLGRNTPGDIRTILLQQACPYDALILLDGTIGLEQPAGLSEEEIIEFLRQSCERLNYLAVVTAKEEAYEEIFEYLNEEYGLTPITVSSLEKVKLPVQSQVLVADAGAMDKKTGRFLPTGCTYLDLLSLEKRRRLLESKRKDIQYVSFSGQVEKKLCQKCEFLGIRS